MDTTKNTIRIDGLDSGFVVTVNGKTRAIENVDKIKSVIFSLVEEEVFKPSKPDHRSVLIYLEVTVNPTENG